MSNKTQTCVACAFTARVSGRGNWHVIHSDCPHVGKDVPASFTTTRCPIHADSPLRWALDPWYTAAQCSNPACGVGRSTKGHVQPFRVFRGGKTNVRDLKPTPAQPTPAPHVQPTQEPTPVKEDPTVQPSPIATNANVDATAIALRNLGSLGESIMAYVEARAAQLAAETVAEAVSKLDARAVTIDLTVNAQPFARIEGTAHKAVRQILDGIAAGFRNFFMVGPAGTGKTTIAQTVANALTLAKRQEDPEADSVACGELSLSGGIPESRLIGRNNMNVTTGESSYESTPFVDLYEAGGVFLLDDCDRGDANMLTCLLSALANGHVALARKGAPIAKRHADSIILCAANTYGTGADRQYVGAGQLDAAFLDRFVGCVIDVDYDRDLESALVGNAHLCARVWSIREKAAELKLRRVVGTRFLLACARWFASGKSLDESIRACVTGWTKDELTKVGVSS